MILSLINGHIPGEDRTQIVQRMAADLIRYEAFSNEGDAMRSLMQAGHSPF